MDVNDDLHVDDLCGDQVDDVVEDGDDDVGDVRVDSGDIGDDIDNVRHDEVHNEVGDDDDGVVDVVGVVGPHVQ